MIRKYRASIARFVRRLKICVFLSLSAIVIRLKYAEELRAAFLAPIDVVTIMGGLGNQMFQYAYYQSLTDSGRMLFADTSYFKHYNVHHGLEIDRAFHVNFSCFSEYLEEKCPRANKWLQLVPPPSRYQYIFKLCGIPQQTYREEDFLCGKSKLSSGLVFHFGYWVGDIYTAHVKNKRDIFRFRETDNAVSDKYLKQIEAAEASVSLHVRRGDYIGSGYVNLGKEYYSAAVQHFRDALNEPVFFCFSNDIEWCRSHPEELGFELTKDNVCFVSGVSVTDGFSDLRLMSSCRHNIIANSTFSLWGALLNTYDGKTVIAPKRYFSENYQKKMQKIEAQYCPNEWIRM